MSIVHCQSLAQLSTINFFKLLAINLLKLSSKQFPKILPPSQEGQTRLGLIPYT
ncbi:hypothetical protein UT300019_31860 [Clostridium sp. CTA-19]